MEKPTASESGRNIALAAPTMNRAGVNIARMQSIANNRGPAVSVVASSAARPSVLPRVRWTWMFSMRDRRLVHQNAHRQRQAAQRHDVDGLPGDPQRQHRAHQREGMLITTMNALRQSRRNSRIIKPVSSAPRAPSSVRPPIARVT